jgi:hypothetical protein
VKNLTAAIDGVAEKIEKNFPVLAKTLDGVSEELLQVTEASAFVPSNAERIFEATKSYGAKSYEVSGQTVQVKLDRGEGVETIASFDGEGERVRIVFESGAQAMVRRAKLQSADAQELSKAVAHVFDTGNDYNP